MANLPSGALRVPQFRCEPPIECIPGVTSGKLPRNNKKGRSEVTGRPNLVSEFKLADLAGRRRRRGILHRNRGASLGGKPAIIGASCAHVDRPGRSSGGIQGGGVAAAADLSAGSCPVAQGYLPAIGT